jgi:thioredoxin reductase (NADPH)
MQESFDLVVVGAGPAGLAAGVYAVRSGLKTVVLEEKIAGGTAVDAPVIQNYLGFASVSGMELAQKMVAHAKAAGVQIREFEVVASLELRRESKVVKTDKAAYEAGAVIIASGSHYHELGIPGEKEFRGRGVSYCGICDGPLFKGKRVLVVGGGNSALMTALYLAERASEVKVAHRRDAFRAEEALVDALKNKDNMGVLLSTEVREIKGERLVNAAVLFDNRSGEIKELPVDGVFIQVGEDPNSRLAMDAGVAVDEDRYVKVDVWQQTSIAGVYAAGDVTNHPVKQIGTAVGQGITAALEAYGFVRRPYYKQRKTLQM